MMTRWLATITTLIAIVVQPTPHPAHVIAHSQPRGGIIDIAVEDEADPWSRKDGSGYANDVVKAAFAAAGVRVRLLVMPYARCKQMAIEGTLPACVSMSANVLKADPVTFSAVPLYVFHSDYFERIDSTLGGRSAADLRRGTRVGVVNGYEYPPSVYALSRDGTIVLDYSASETINLRKLVAGRLDAALVNHNALKTIDYITETAAVTGKVRPVFSAGELPGYIGFSRKHPLAAWALQRYRRGEIAIAANGTLARIRDQWSARVNASRREARRDTSGGRILR